MVRATDGGGKMDHVRVRVEVDDVNDNTPVFSLPQYQANVAIQSGLAADILQVGWWGGLGQLSAHIRLG